MSGPPDARIRALADLQHGRVARRQLIAAGITRDAIKARLRTGVLAIERHGVYTAAHSTSGPYAKEVAALLTCRCPALIAGATAAAMWHLPVAHREEATEVLVAARFGARVRSEVVTHRTADAEHLTPRFVDRIPVTDPAWTLLDVAGRLTSRQLERALDEALALKITTLKDVDAVVTRNRTRRGASTLARLVKARMTGAPSARTHNGGEEQLLTLLRAANVTGFHTQESIGPF